MIFFSKTLSLCTYAPPVRSFADWMKSRLPVRKIELPDLNLSITVVGIPHGKADAPKTYKKALERHVNSSIGSGKTLVLEQGLNFGREGQEKTTLVWPTYTQTPFNREASRIPERLEFFVNGKYRKAKHVFHNLHHNEESILRSVTILKTLLGGLEKQPLTYELEKLSPHNQAYLISLASLAFALQFAQKIDQMPPKTTKIAAIMGTLHRDPFTYLLSHPNTAYELSHAVLTTHNIEFTEAPTPPKTMKALAAWIQTNQDHEGFKQVFGMEDESLS